MHTCSAPDAGNTRNFDAVSANHITGYNCLLAALIQAPIQNTEAVQSKLIIKSAVNNQIIPMTIIQRT